VDADNFGAVSAVVNPTIDRVYLYEVNHLAPCRAVGCSFLNSNAVGIGDEASIGLYADGYESIGLVADSGIFNIGLAGVNGMTFETFADEFIISLGRAWYAVMIDTAVQNLIGYSDVASSFRENIGKYYDSPAGFAAGLPSQILVADMLDVAGVGPDATFTLQSQMRYEF